MIPVEAMLCARCGHIDDVAGERCPCPHSAAELHQRQREVDRRHQDAVRLARWSDYVQSARYPDRAGRQAPSG